MKKALAFFISAALFLSMLTLFPAIAGAVPVSRYAQLLGISAEAGVWSREFAPGRYSYVLRLGENEGSVTITPVKEDPAQVLYIDGSAADSAAVILDNGRYRIIKIKVTLEGKKSRTYSVKVMRAASTNNDLNSLKFSAGTADAEFAPELTEYNVSLPYYSPCVIISAAKADSHSVLRIDARRAESRKFWVKPGERITVEVTVRSQAKATKTYTVHIAREACAIEDRAQALLEFAKYYIGCQYVRGGKGPGEFDCSGFVYFCLNGVGIEQSYMTSRVWPKSNYTTAATLNDMLPGDILCFTGHVGIYAGGGMMIDASSGAVGIRSCTTPYWTQSLICGKRVIEQSSESAAQ